MEKTHLLIAKHSQKTVYGLPLNYHLDDNLSNIYDTFQFLINNKSESLLNHPSSMESENDNHQNKFSDWNKNKELSDTQGDLKGAVYFAQNTVIPAVNRIEGDVQPTIVSDRETLVMFKPQHYLNKNSHVLLRIYDSKNNLMTTQKMKPPSELPQIADSTIKKTNISPNDFSKQWGFDIQIKNSRNLNQRLHHTMINNKYIALTIDKNKSKNEVILISDRKYIDTHIELSNTSGSEITINYSNNKTTLPENHKIQFICDENGHWITKSDAQLAQYYSLPIETPASLTPDLSKLHTEKSNIIVNENDKISKVSNQDGYFNELIKNHHTIHIKTSDGHWAKNFVLTANNSFHHKKVVFTSSATLDSYISYGNKNYKLAKGKNIAFEYDLYKKWQPLTEKISTQPHEELNYIENTWSVIIPKYYIKPDIRFEFNTSSTKGVLSNIKIGSPNVTLINTIDIGMLTPPRGKLDFQSNPELHRQYYQTIPVKNLIVTQFEPVYLNEVVMPNGEVFTEKATGNGGGHEGNMRHQIGKDLISDGINLANYGVHSTAAEYSFTPTFQVTVHNSIGLYENGKQVHGWSGGAGKVTLYDSRGNELSHELGHNFGLGDYHGGVEGGTHAPANKKNASWLWDADHNYFIPNMTKEGKLNKDAMSGGTPYDQKYNAYTLYTPNSLFAIQQRLENSYIFSPTSKTGYQKWDPKIEKMIDTALDLSQFYFFNYSVSNGEVLSTEKINTLINQYKFIHIESGNGYHSPEMSLPAASHENKNAIVKISSFAHWKSHIHVNGDIESINNNQVITFISNGSHWEKSDSQKITKKPYKQGVPIVNLTGFYDPEGKMAKQSCIPLYGSYGMVYQPDKQITSGAPFLEVIMQNGKKQRYQLSNFRASKDLMNKFHVNIERELNPITANIYVNNKIVHTQQIEIKSNKLSTTINGNII